MSRDELASALLDGEVAGPSAVDEALATRIEELRQASEAIGAPVTVDDDARERAIAAALAEFDAPAEPVTSHAAPTALPQRRRLLPVLAGAAAAVVVLAGVAALLQRDDSNPTEAASVSAPTEAVAGRLSAATTTIAPSAAGGAANADAAAESATPPNAAAPAARDLGDISNDEQLRAALGVEAFATKGANVSPDACEAAARASVSGDLGTLTGTVTLRWQEQPARALLFVGADDEPHIVVVADPGCEVLDQIG